jgi:phosphopantothenoylcysteine decarboxylase/phosphopantothenate--cysteine ligase
VKKVNGYLFNINSSLCAMHGLSGKKILLGITGSIAAYKSAFLTRLLIKAGAEVQIVMTPAATDFITPLTLATLSKKNVFTSVSAEDSWNNHVEMGLWADVMLVAPATATTLSKMAHGICDSIIVATYLSAKCPVFFAPAMDLDMWKHPATLDNVKRLQSFGNKLIPVGHGELASGLSGDGRMAEPEDIVQTLSNYFAKAQSLKGKTALVTAGPTYESLDPVRFIGNHSSGKMGIAIAEELANKGAAVTLVLGPSKEEIENENINVIRIRSAQEMYEACATVFPTTDISVLAAAVADYRPKTISTEKIKKSGNDLSIDLERTTDIAATLGKTKKKGQLLIGFALETNNEVENAKGKLERKNFDFIVLNSLQDKGAGFQHNTNKITIVGQNNKIKEFELKTKVEVAVDIVEEIVLTANY